MNSRLEALIKRGYNKEEVLRLATFTEEELNIASILAFEHISRNCTRVEDPQAIFIGGQPGCGKTVLSYKFKNEISNIIEIGIDNYRMYHPRYLEIEKYIREFWKDKKETENESPGNDIADFTHLFAGAMTDKLISMGSIVDKDGKSYNMVLEWGMREPTGPLKTMKELKNKAYNNIVIFVSTHKDISYEACKLRADIMKKSKHIIRKVPKSFHEICIETLPSSIDQIYLEGYKEQIIDYMMIVNRDNKILWDDKKQEKPSIIYAKYLKEKIDSKENFNNPIISYKTNEKEMIGLKKQNTLNELKKIKTGIIAIINNQNNKEKQR